MSAPSLIDVHTPGPWKVTNDKNWGLGVEAVNNPHGDRFDFPIVEFGHVGGDGRGIEATGGTPEANARLIAAAPELLAVAKTLIAAHEEQGLEAGMLLGCAHEMAVAAIAKVAGETP